MKKLTTTEFIHKAKGIHGIRYDYSESIYTMAREKVKIYCVMHGMFEQTPNAHLRGQGCPSCSGTKLKSNEQVVNDFELIHGDVYDYSKTKYINDGTKVIVVCRTHGEFGITPSNHIHNKRGCPECGGSKRKTQDEVINDFVTVHGYRYDYSQMIYLNDAKKICIVCPIHGEFWQAPSYHKRGSGCPTCVTSKGETLIRNMLMMSNIDFRQQYMFGDCRGKCRPLPFDFYIPSRNICIEFDGLQHFRPVKRFGGEVGFSITKKHDEIKNEYCIINNISLIRIPYYEINNIEPLLGDLIFHDFTPVSTMIIATPTSS
jgi:hypothetical protein